MLSISFILVYTWISADMNYIYIYIYDNKNDLHQQNISYEKDVKKRRRNIPTKVHPIQLSKNY